ncbi:MAG: SRPBCC family protein [Gaiellaceae bacterium]
MDVTRELVLPARPAEVWKALTDPDQLEEWFANDVELDPEPGGEGVFRWDDGEVRRARVEEVEVGRRFSFRWSEEESPAEETHVAFTLEEVPEGTRVTVTESAPGPSACAGEWSSALELRALLASVPALL